MINKKIKEKVTETVIESYKLYMGPIFLASINLFYCIIDITLIKPYTKFILMFFIVKCNILI